MNIFMRVAINSLKSAKSRTVVTIVGVALSACLFTIVTTLIFSGYEMVEDATFCNVGDYQIRICDNDNRYFTSMSEDKNIEILSQLNEVGYGRINMDYIPNVVEIEDMKSIMPKVRIYSRNNLEDEYIGVKITEGRKPTNNNEIIISESVAADLGDNGQIGDNINISVIEIINDIENDADFDRNVVYNTYEIVGIFSKRDGSYVAQKEYAFTFDKNNNGQQGKMFFIKYNEKEYSKKSLFEKYRLTKQEAKKNGLWYEFNGMSKIRNIAIVILVLNSVYFVIFIATAVMMSSTFSISYNERIKQLGLIKSLGATKRQLRKIINYEAKCVSIIGVPIGMLSGIIAMNIVEFFMKKNIQSSALIKYFEEYDIIIKYEVSIEALIVSLVFILLTIKIAELSTLNKVSRLKTMEALLDNKAIKLKPKKLKVGKLFLKYTSIEKFMSKKYYKASKKMYRVTVICLAVSILIIVSTFTTYDLLIKMIDSSISVCDYDIRINEYENPSPTYGISLYNYKKAKSSIRSKSSMKNINIYAKDDVAYPMCNISKENFTDEAIKDMELFFGEEQKNVDNYEVMFSNLFVDEETYMNIITEAGLDYIKYTSTEQPPAILYNVTDKSTIYSDKKQIYNIFKNPIYQFDLIYEADEENVEEKPKYITIGDMVNTRLKGLDTYSPYSIYLIYPDYMAENVQSYIIAFDTDDYNMTMQELESWRKANNIGKDDIEDKNEIKELIEASRGMTRIVSNGFIVLIIMIAMANVFNTIMANILSRRRDFAVLKSTGMSDKLINKMLVYECITYGTKAVIWGLILSILSTCSSASVLYMEKKNIMTNNIVRDFITCFNETMPWTVAFIAIILVYIVVFISAFYALNRVKKNNIIETLKNDLV